MPNRIRLLEDSVANKIAAGEVVERPLSVVKELVENSLDANAEKIFIRIQKGGKNLIQVTDDGDGMTRNDALLSLERHATSKITCIEDLNEIASYGFRGEAVPSIASVSKFRLVTRPQGQDVGTEILIEGGILRDVKEAGCAKGTMVEVRSLFWNVPARRKFLKTEQTEWAHIDQHLRLIALMRPQLYLTVEHNAKQTHQYLPAKNLRERLCQIFGKKWVEDTLEVNASTEDFTLTGFVGKPGIGRATRNEQLFFVNGRPIQSSIFNFALREAYQGALAKERYPVAVLFLQMSGQDVDVNVHPSKKEVRFRNNFQVRNFIVEAIYKTLHGKEGSLSPIVAPLVPEIPQKESSFQFETHAKPEGDSYSEPLPKQSLSPAMESSAQVSSTFPNLQVFGVILDTYIVAQNDSGLVLIDQKAAHERILFEKLLKQADAGQASSQALLIPVTVELSPADADFIGKQLKQMQKIGLGVSNIGGNTFMIDAIPADFEISDIESFFKALIVDLQEEGGESRRKKTLDTDVLVRKICHRAVSRGRPLKQPEIRKLLEDLYGCDLPYTCPQGNPTMIMISANELAKKFGKRN